MMLERLLKDEEFTTTEKAIIAYILQYPQNVLKMSASELAQASFSSPAAVSRLCRKLDLDGFGELKVVLAKEAQGSQTLEPVNADFPELENRTAEQIIRTVSSMEQRAIRETEAVIDTLDWNRIVDELEQAPGIAIYGIGFSLNASINFESNMRRLGYRVTREEDESRMTTWAAICDKREFSILISYSGRALLRVAEILKIRGMRSLCIAAAGNSKLSALTTYHIPVALTEGRLAFNRMAPLSSTLECSFVLDALYATLFSRHYMENCEKLNQILEIQEYLGDSERKSVKKQ